MIDEAVQATGDIVYGNHFRTLVILLRDADNDPEYAKDNQAVLAEIGRALRADGRWRAQFKLSAGWDGHKTAWAALESFIEKHRTAGPWWEILRYADGQKVTPEVEAFFTK